MTALKTVIDAKSKGLLNIYCTAGYPELDSLPIVLKSLHDAGADMVEVGIPYSDPIADGLTIQGSNSQALSNGISLELIFDQLESCDVPIPRILMGYFNSVFQFGLEEFIERCKRAKVDGIILPDLPVDLYEREYKEQFADAGISVIFLVTPQTSDDRIRQIDSLSSTFIYAVSSASTTGSKSALESSEAYLEKLSSMNLSHPVLVGFNIKTSEDLEFVGKYANGGIIGSAFINHIKSSSMPLGEACESYIKALRS